MARDSDQPEKRNDQPSGLSRRQFLGTSAALSAATPLLGCGDKVAKSIFPYVIPPDDTVPGIAKMYRTVCRGCPAGCGVAARNREGRVVKLEGNPEHPINQGALCLRGQAAIQELYDPGRLTRPLAGSAPTTWDQAEASLADALKRCVAEHKQIVVVTRPEHGVLSEIFRGLLRGLGQDPNQVVTYSPSSPTWQVEAARATFGIAAQPVYDLTQAEAVVAIGADLLEDWGSPVEYGRGLGELRARGVPTVYVGPRLSLTATQFDTWLSPRPGSELSLVLGLLNLTTKSGFAYPVARVAAETGLAPEAIERLGQMLLSRRPSLLIGPGPAVAGEDAAAIAKVVNLINHSLGNLGQETRPVMFLHAEEPGTSFGELLRRAAAGELGALIVHHADVLGSGPAARPFRDALGRIPFVASFTNRLDETAKASHLALPDHHFLETWGDVVVRPGITGIQQPTMVPLHDTRAAGDVLLSALRRIGATDVPSHLASGSLADIIQAKYQKADLERGGVFKPVAQTLTVTEDPLAGVVPGPAKLSGPETGLALIAFQSLRHPEGKPSANPLLQEIPDPLTAVTWSGWAELHPATASRLGLKTEDVVSLDDGAARVELPVYVRPGVREDVVAVPAAYLPELTGGGAEPPLGRTRRVKVSPTGRRMLLPRTQETSSQDGREMARHVRPGESTKREPHHASMYEHKHAKHRWVMAIDLDRCSGCSACVAACSVENNIPIVGPEDVSRGHEMSWLRMTRYIEGPADRPEVSFQPMMCQQCCNAPCEAVCPVYATYHHPEGVNAQIYNRCVGTRYCANNCPYTARRFNWYNWKHPSPSHFGLNPDVSVRERGTMEKCTFCFHRIRLAEEQAKLEGRKLAPEEIVPACAQTCPSSAIVFGDLNDPAWRVNQVLASNRSYRALEHLNTEPGVYYLARVTKEKP